MRNLLTAVFFGLLTLSVISCGKDAESDINESRLKVTEADVTFDTQGGDGFIKVTAPGAVTAKSNAEWCTVDVSGTTISLKAEANTSMGGRTATITIESEKETIDITAVQTAAIMWLKKFKGNTIAFPSEGATVETEIASSYPVVVEDKPDWITYRFENGSLYLTADPGIPRKGVITFSSQGRTQAYNLVQASYAGFLGEWEMHFNNPAQGNRLESTTVIFEEKVKNESFLLKNLVITGSTEAEIQVDFNAFDNNVTISAGQYLMTAADGRFVYLCLRSATGSYVWTTNAQLAGTLDIADDGTVTYVIDDNGTWSGVAKGFGFYLFTGEPPASTTSTGSSYRRFMNIVLIKK